MVDLDHLEDPGVGLQPNLLGQNPDLVIPPNQEVKDLLKLPLVTHQVNVAAGITVHHKEENRDQGLPSPETLRTNREGQSNQECLHPGDPLETRLLGLVAQ